MPKTLLVYLLPHTHAQRLRLHSSPPPSTHARASAPHTTRRPLERGLQDDPGAEQSSERSGGHAQVPGAVAVVLRTAKGARFLVANFRARGGAGTSHGVPGNNFLQNRRFRHGDRPTKQTYGSLRVCKFANRHEKSVPDLHCTSMLRKHAFLETFDKGNSTWLP